MHEEPHPSLNRLRERAVLLSELRKFFDERGFLEVQPPCLSRDCVIDPYIDPIRVQNQAMQLEWNSSKEFFLQTSPEAAMKRLLSSGAPSIYSLGPVFRAGERGQQHNVEFTMLEWYEVGADAEDGIELLGILAAEILGTSGCDIYSYCQLFLDRFGFDPIAANHHQIFTQAKQIDRQLAESLAEDREALLDLIMSHVVQPSLGIERPAIVRDYPLSQAALAKQSAVDARCAARFELFVAGVELANGYDELRDADVLIKRFKFCNEKRSLDGRRMLNMQTPFVSAMQKGLPACTGVALGVDRLLMVRTGESSIANVMPFSIDTV